MSSPGVYVGCHRQVVRLVSNIHIGVLPFGKFIFNLLCYQDSTDSSMFCHPAGMFLAYVYGVYNHHVVVLLSGQVVCDPSILSFQYSC